MDKGEKFQKAVRTALEAGREIMEIGVFQGHTFHWMAKEAKKYGRKAIAVDSWEGMATPGKGEEMYPKGMFSLGGVERFHKLMEARGLSRSDYLVYPGWIPYVFGTVVLNGVLGFVHIDVDHFIPTLEAAQWVWSQFGTHGTIAFHDWFPGRMTLAAGAISQFLSNTAKRSPDGIRVSVEGMEMIISKP